jgi:hypothetical protein
LGQLIDHLVKLAVPIVTPTSLLSHSFDHMGGRSPRLFRGLKQVVLGQRLSGFRQQFSAGCGGPLMTYL